MVRARALVQCGGYRENLMAGEEPELCLRLREDGWKVWRLEDDMAFHDAELTSFGQWWRRTKRGGYAYAEVSSLHIHSPERFWRKETFRAVFWAGILPILVFGGSFAHPLALSLGVLYPVQIARLAVREGDGKASWVYAHFMMLAKFAEFAGIVQFLWKSWFAKRSGLFAGIADNRKRLTDWRSR